MHLKPTMMNGWMDADIAAFPTVQEKTLTYLDRLL